VTRASHPAAYDAYEVTLRGRLPSHASHLAAYQVNEDVTRCDGSYLYNAVRPTAAGMAHYLIRGKCGKPQEVGKFGMYNLIILVVQLLYK
jgi:hypothetical protein